MQRLARDPLPLLHAHHHRVPVTFTRILHARFGFSPTGTYTLLELAYPRSGIAKTWPPRQTLGSEMLLAQMTASSVVTNS